MSTPIADMLKRYRESDILRMCMPGHKGRLNAADITELSDSDNLLSPNGVIAKSQNLYAKEKRAASCFYSLAGSSAPILAMMSYFSPGSKIIMARDFHISAENGMVLSGIVPIYVEVECGIEEPPKVDEDSVMRAIVENPDAKAVYLTYPTYMGRAAELERIGRAVRSAGMLFIIDSAHGAHLGYTDQLPPDAGRYADIWCESLHKTLPSMGMTAALFASDRVDAERLKRALNRVHTTSPSYVLLESIDKARDFMRRKGKEKLEELLCTLRVVREKINSIDGLKCLATDDMTKLVIDVSGRGITGYRAAEELHGMGIEVECAEPSRILCITTVSDTKEDMDRLVSGLNALSRGNTVPPAFKYVLRSGTEMTPREAALGRTCQVSRSDAKGRICAASVYCYPPGVALIAAGQRITPEAVELLNALDEAGCEIKPNGYLLVCE